jgi:hypothetical protein
MDAGKKLIQFKADESLINKIKKIKQKHFKDMHKSAMLQAFVTAYEKTQIKKGE